MKYDLKTIDELERKAEREDADSQFYLGYMFFFGEGGVKVDYSKAKYWYEKAAKQDHAPAQCGLGNIYFIDGDYEKATYWYKESAEQGFDNAQARLKELIRIGCCSKDLLAEIELLLMYDKVDGCMKAGKYKEAIKLLKPILETKEVYSFTSGAYVNMAAIELNYYSNAKKAEQYLLKALEIKSNNKMAPGYLFLIYFLEEKYEKAIEMLALSDNEVTKAFLEKDILSKVILPAAYYFQTEIGVKLLNNFERNAIIDKLVELFPENYYLRYTFAEMCMYMDTPELLKAYDFLKKLIVEYPKVPVAYRLLARICDEYNLNMPIEQEKYSKFLLSLSEKGIQEYAGTGLKKAEIFECEYEIAERELYLAYINQGKYDEALTLIKKRLSKHVTETDLHNYALALYKSHDYSEALVQCKRSLHIVEDESNYWLLGEITFAIERYEEAAGYYEKALAFCYGEQNRKFGDNEKVVLSISTKTWALEKEKKIYHEIIKTYLKLKNYSKAKFYLKKATEKFTEDKSYDGLGITLEAIQSNEDAHQDLSVKFQQMTEELQQEITVANQRVGKVKQWAKELIVLQGKQIGEFDIDNTDWTNFTRNMDGIIQQMVSETDGKKQEYKKIKQSLFERYNKLEKKSLEFLSTAEILYDIHQFEMIDFAPIIVEYAKVLENELKVFLNRRFKLPKSLTLGESLTEIRERKIMPWYDSIDDLYIINRFRNDSAHDGMSTKEKVEELRQLYYSNILDLVEQAKRM